MYIKINAPCSLKKKKVQQTKNTKDAVDRGEASFLHPWNVKKVFQLNKDKKKKKTLFIEEVFFFSVFIAHYLKFFL